MGLATFLSPDFSLEPSGHPAALPSSLSPTKKKLSQSGNPSYEIIYERFFYKFQDK
jgi:hypothetical protein